MSKSSPFILDRAIPLYPGLAMFLDFLPGVDPATSRKRTNKKTGKTSPVSMTTRGMIRALVLTQLDHRLRDNPADRDLLIRDGMTWYARSYASWHYWDFRMFMSFPTMKRAFQDLAAAGYIRTRKQTDLVTGEIPLAERNAVKKIMHVYNGVAWSLDYEKLEADMASHAEVQAYYADRERAALPESSDQADPTGATSDQPDPTPRISLIRQVGSGRSDSRDQADPTGGISLIRDQQSLDQTPSQPLSEFSAAADTDSQTGAEENKRAIAEVPATPPVKEKEPLYKNLTTAQVGTYGHLVSAFHVDPKDAADIAQRCDPEQIKAWEDYILRANTPGSGLKEVGNPGGYLVAMLKHASNYPRPVKGPAQPGDRFLRGPMAGEIDH